VSIKKENNFIYFFDFRRLTVVLKIFDTWEMGNYVNVLGYASDIYFCVGFPESNAPYFFIGQ
jgi:hypothetical protein